MKLSLWTYEGPTHVGAMRVVNSMRNSHFVLHAPQGDTYADLLFTMIERQGRRPPVTYTTFQARDLGADTAKLFVDSVAEAADRFKPEVMFVGESCTAELIQDQPGSLAAGMALDIPVVPLELPAYSRKENHGASETLYGLVRAVLKGAEPQPPDSEPSVNLIGPSSLGFRARDDVREISALLQRMGVRVNVVAPLDAGLADIARLPKAMANVCLYPEVGRTTCDWLKRKFKQPVIDIVPIGVGATREFVQAVADCTGVDPAPVLQADASRLPWYSRSIDSNYLTAKRVFIFGDATHALAAARVATQELGFDVVGLGTYSREFAREVRSAAESYGLTALITDDYLEVEEAVKQSEPELVLGTQMERHVAKRLGIGCCVISAPFHVEDVPARYAPQMGYEGANVLFDTWVHPLMMGLEEHLLGMFTDDFEFNDTQMPSHLAHRGSQESATPVATVDAVPATPVVDDVDDIRWSTDAEQELKKVPFFVRGKARRNTERYACQQGLSHISLETLYDAKAYYSN
jgi:light-independent protochlorophyllide reductase subunit B